MTYENAPYRIGHSSGRVTDRSRLLPPYFEVSEGARGADIEATITDLNAERMARLHGRIRLSTRELIAAAAPTDDAATKPIQANRGSWTRSWVTFSCLRHLIQPQTPFFDH